MANVKDKNKKGNMRGEVRESKNLRYIDYLKLL
jgi:hypothetical protein